MRKNVFLVITLCALLAVSFNAGCGRRGTGARGNADITDLQGKPIDLGKYKGKVVLVNYWATWCQPCNIEIPWMIGFQEKYGSRGFTVLGVSMDDEGRSVVESFVSEKRWDVDGKEMVINYPILIGNDAVGDQFGGIIGLPTTVVIGRDGKVVKRFLGLASHDKLVKEIEGQL